MTMFIALFGVIKFWGMLGAMLHSGEPYLSPKYLRKLRRCSMQTFRTFASSPIIFSCKVYEYPPALYCFMLISNQVHHSRSRWIPRTRSSSLQLGLVPPFGCRLPVPDRDYDRQLRHSPPQHPPHRRHEPRCLGKIQIARHVTDVPSLR